MEMCVLHKENAETDAKLYTNTWVKFGEFQY